MLRRALGRKRAQPRAGAPRVVAFPAGRANAVPAHIRVPDYVGLPHEPGVGSLSVKSPAQQVAMRIAGQLARRVLDHAGSLVAAGVTTDEIDRAAHSMIVDADAYPSPLGYGGFPRSICTSINEVLCHGIPDTRRLAQGDIINIDVTVFTRDGVHGDVSETYAVGKIDAASKALIAATREALAAGIAVCRPGAKFGEIGDAVQAVADQHGLTTSADFCAHGIGAWFHEEPIITHVGGKAARGLPFRDLTMRPGMTFTVEPILVEGDSAYRVWDDGWTAVASGGGRSAQFEQTLLVTQDGVDVLTAATADS